MKKYYPWVALVFLLVGVLMWFGYPKQKRNDVSVVREPEVTAKLKDQGLKEVTQKTAGKKNGTQAPELPLSPGDLAKLEGFKERWAESNGRSLDFFGRVVDQFGDPVQEAVITGNVLRATGFTATKTEQILTRSDLNGYFSFSGVTGANLGVVPSKIGYEFKHVGQTGWTPDYKPDPSNPVILPMWKKSQPAPLVHSAIRSYIPCNGVPTTYDLLLGQVVSDGGDLIVRLERTPVDIVRGKPFDWKVTLLMTSGGLVETQDLYQNEAPASGYSNSLTLEMSMAAKDWSPSIVRAFYFQSRNGQVYGRMLVNITADFQPPPTVFQLEVYANPTGSRNLQYDPAFGR